MEALRKFLDLGAPTLIAPSGETARLPPELHDLLKQAANLMARGEVPSLHGHGPAITTQQAADMLGVSRPHLVKMLESGVMAFHKVGNQRRVRLDDVVAYASKRTNAAGKPE